MAELRSTAPRRAPPSSAVIESPCPPLQQPGSTGTLLPGMGHTHSETQGVDKGWKQPHMTVARREESRTFWPDDRFVAQHRSAAAEAAFLGFPPPYFSPPSTTPGNDLQPPSDRDCLVDNVCAFSMSNSLMKNSWTKNVSKYVRFAW